MIYVELCKAIQINYFFNCYLYKLEFAQETNSVMTDPRWPSAWVSYAAKNWRIRGEARNVRHLSVIFTVRKRSLRRLCFHRGLPDRDPPDRDPCGQRPPGQRPPVDRDPPGQRPSGQRTVTSGRYASYWDTFLFFIFIQCPGKIGQTERFEVCDIMDLPLHAVFIFICNHLTKT